MGAPGLPAMEWASSAAAETGAAPAADDRVGASEVAVGSDGWEEEAARSLRDNGYAVLVRRPGAGLLTPAQCAACAASALSRLELLIGALRARGSDPIADTFKYSEVCKRHSGGRFDVSMPLADDPSWAELAASAEAWALPVLRRAGLMKVCSRPPLPFLRIAWACAAPALGLHWPYLSGVGTAPAWACAAVPFTCVHLPYLRAPQTGGRRDRVGCVCALPGTPAQGFHVDGTDEGLVNAFVPLVDVNEDNGTQIEPGCALHPTGTVSITQKDCFDSAT